MASQVFISAKQDGKKVYIPAWLRCGWCEVFPVLISQIIPDWLYKFRRSHSSVAEVRQV